MYTVVFFLDPSANSDNSNMTICYFVLELWIKSTFETLFDNKQLLIMIKNQYGWKPYSEVFAIYDSVSFCHVPDLDISNDLINFMKAECNS